MHAMAALACVAVLTALGVSRGAHGLEHNMRYYPSSALHSDDEPLTTRAVYEATVDGRSDAMRCALCQGALVPAVLRAMVDADSTEPARDVVRDGLLAAPYIFAFNTDSQRVGTQRDTAVGQKMPSDEMRGDAPDDDMPQAPRGADKVVLEAAHHVLWDTEASQRAAAVVRTYREHGSSADRGAFAALLELQLCSCDEVNIMRSDAPFGRLLDAHARALEKEVVETPLAAPFAVPDAVLEAERELAIRDEEALQRGHEALERAALDEM